MATLVLPLAGAVAARDRVAGRRIRMAMLALLVLFGAIGARLVQLGLTVADTTIEGVERDSISASRPELLDREGIPTALDLRVPSLFAEPRNIVDVEEAVTKIRRVLPELDETALRTKLSTDKGFVWIKRELTPAQGEAIERLGLPGVDFLSESRRFYPGGPEASHVLGTVNVDNQGISGIEKYLDQTDLALLQDVGLARDAALTPVVLSLDVRVQHVVRQELLDALSRYQAIAAAAVMLDVRTGEVIALSSLPDFDPNDPKSALLEGRLNRIAAGSFKLGSTSKSVTFAAALDSGKVSLTDSFDARSGIRFGRFTINDFHGKNRILTMPEVYKYSSNVGTIRIEQTLGKDAFRSFLSRVHLDTELRTELPESTRPKVPDTFSDIVAATASFGHGISVTPLQMAAVMAAFVNGGTYLKPTFFPRTPGDVKKLAERIIQPATSERLRYLMRLNAREGSGTRMNKIAAGYRAGGKTGTAEKVVKGRYQSNTNLNVFASAFPLDSPKYVMVLLVDEPKAENPQSGTTAGWNAGAITGRIIRRVAPMLGVAPDFDDTLDDALTPAELR